MSSTHYDGDLPIPFAPSGADLDLINRAVSSIGAPRTRNGLMSLIKELADNAGRFVAGEKFKDAHVFPRDVHSLNDHPELKESGIQVAMLGDYPHSQKISEFDLVLIRGK